MLNLTTDEVAKLTGWQLAEMLWGTEGIPTRATAKITIQGTEVKVSTSQGRGRNPGLYITIALPKKVHIVDEDGCVVKTYDAHDLYRGKASQHLKTYKCFAEGV